LVIAGFLLAVAVPGEFIVGLQILRTNMEDGQVRMAAQVQGRWRGARLAPEQESHRGSAGGVSRQGFLDGPPQRRRAIVVQQLHQLRRLCARRFSLRERQVEQLPALWHGLCQTASRGGMEGLAFERQDRVLMRRVEDELMPVITAQVAGQFGRAVENAHHRVAGRQRQRAAYGLGRNRVVVEVEANIDRFAGLDRHDAVGRKGMLRQWQQPSLFLGERLGHGAVIPARPAALMGHFVAPEPSLAIAFGQRGENAAGPERVAHVADRSLHAPFLVPGADLARAGGEVIVPTQFDQPGMELDLVAAPFQHDTFEILCAVICNVE
jgi:hypothetical protein